MRVIPAVMFFLNSYITIRLLLMGGHIDTQREALMVSVLNVAVLTAEILLDVK